MNYQIGGGRGSVMYFQIATFSYIMLYCAVVSSRATGGAVRSILMLCRRAAVSNCAKELVSICLDHECI